MMGVLQINQQRCSASTLPLEEMQRSAESGWVSRENRLDGQSNEEIASFAMRGSSQ